VREWNSEHKKIKRVLKELSAIGEQLIRNHVRDQRQQASEPSLRLLPEASAEER
jgi:hypothetical protein